MKQNPLVIPQKKMAQNRNAFSRGFDTKITTSAGILTPVFSEPVLGSSKVRINRQTAFRSAQVNTAAFQEFDQFVDFYFVPFRQLFSYYGSMRVSTNDFVSNKLNVVNLPPSFPFTSIDNITKAFRGDTVKDMFGFDRIYGALRLLDLLNLGTLKEDHTFEADRFVYSGQSFVPWYLLAYQKIWYDHYRNTSYIFNDPAAYNMDNLVASGGQVNSFADDQLRKIAELRYVPYRKDYFMSIYPSLNYTINSQPSLFKVPSSVVQYVSEGAENFVPQFTQSQTNPSDPVNPEDPVGAPFNNALAFLRSSDSSNYSTLSVQSIRAAFALDKLTRLAAYAPKHVADQFEVRFGFRPYAEDLNESKRIGSFKASMSVTEVLSTADTGNGDKGAPLGALGGRGLLSAGSGNTIEFEVPEDGVIMGLMYFLPRMSYDSGGIDSFAQIISPVELPDPVFMNLGLEPVYQKELYGITYNLQNNPQDSEYIDLVNRANNMVLGYQERYKRFKCGISRNHGLFRAGYALSDFSIHTRFDRMHVPTNDELSEDFGNSGVPANFFYVSPKDLSYIFVEAYDGREITDQFFGMLRFDFDVVQPLSIHGQPTI